MWGPHKSPAILFLLLLLQGVLLSAAAAAEGAAAEQTAADAGDSTVQQQPPPPETAPEQPGQNLKASSVRGQPPHPLQADCKSLGSGCQACTYHSSPRSRGLLAAERGQEATPEQADEEGLLQSWRDGGIMEAGSANSTQRGGRGPGRPQPGSSSPAAGRSDGGGSSTLTCTLCDMRRNYQLQRLPDGTQRCGCSSGYGAYMPGGGRRSAFEGYYQQQHLDGAYTCKTCPAGQVPFLPGSNLQLVWDGADWWIELINYDRRSQGGSGSSSDGGSGLADGRTVMALAADAAEPPAAGSAAALAARPAGEAAVLQQEAVEPQQLSTAGGSVSVAHAHNNWYQRGCSDYHHGQPYVPPPLYPGQCVTCPEGSHQDGNQCVASGPPPPPPSPGPSPSPRPSPSPTPSPSPSPSPTPTPSPSPSPSPMPPVPSPSPAPSTYCCGVQNCPFPVPVPPQTQVMVAADGAPPLPAAAAKRRVARSNSNIWPPRNRVLEVPRHPFAPKQRGGGRQQQQPGVQRMCEANPRVKLPPPEQWPGTINGAYATITIWFADTTPGSTCQWNSPSTAFGFPCTAQQLAPYLLLTAAHCVEAPDLAAYPGCAAITVADIEICYEYEPEDSNGDVFWRDCANVVQATGVSWQRSRGPPERIDIPFDQAVIFTGDRRDGPFMQYNYIENIQPAFTGPSTWRTRNFVYEGYDQDTDPLLNGCGCKVCNTTCDLALSGLYIGAPAFDLDAFDTTKAIKPFLEACVGASGSCVSLNGDACCAGTYSYERIPPNDQDVCTPNCDNWWSVISKDKPLSALWSAIQLPLPRWG